MLAALLKKNGYEVLETANGSEAWEALQKPEAPPLVILDWIMPIMDGVEVVRHVRGLETERPPYILMLTAKDRKTDIVDGWMPEQTTT